MTYFEIIYILTNFIYSLSIKKMYETFFDEKPYNKKIEVISYIIYTIALSLIIFVTRIPYITLMFNLSSFFLISFNYKSLFPKRILVSMLTYSMFLIIEIIIAPIFEYLDICLSKESEFRSATGLVAMRIVTLFLSHLINKFLKFKDKDFSIPFEYYALFIFAMSGNLYLYLSSLNNKEISILGALIKSIVFIATNMIIIIIDDRTYKLLINSEERAVLKEQNKAYENQVQLINQSNETIKSLKHNMNNHIIMLGEMLKCDKKEDVENYLGEIIKNINGDEISNSNNFVIDSIVNFKIRQAISNGICPDININVPQEMNILSSDLTAILGNLIDNAITATLNCKNKKLNLSISYNMGNLIILTENPYNGNLKIENGQFHTTKKSDGNHGLGLLSVKKTVEKYYGELRVDYNDEIFSVCAVIPIKN